ncbi:hypothetical protein H9L39_11505 [Fusarium oxysporum f. sp. albedinis]|nr:hypothetical protein H9L39_11505 [Fusarium oxysporum f. sp. albedinis]
MPIAISSHSRSIDEILKGAFPFVLGPPSDTPKSCGLLLFPLHQGTKLSFDLASNKKASGSLPEESFRHSNLIRSSLFTLQNLTNTCKRLSTLLRRKSILNTTPPPEVPPYSQRIKYFTTVALFCRVTLLRPLEVP